MTDGFEESAIVEPIDPFEGGVFHRIQRAPGSTSVDHLGLEQTDDGFGRGVVAGVSRGTYRGFHACVLESFAVSNEEILNASVALMNEPFADMTGV